MSPSRARRILIGTREALRSGGRLPLCVTWQLEYSPEPMTTERCLDVIDELAELGTQSIRLEGETLLDRADLRTLVQRIRFHAIGLLVSAPPERLPRRLKHLGGAETVAVRVGTQPLDIVREAVRALAERGVRRVVRLMIGPGTPPARLEGALDLCADLGAGLVLEPRTVVTPTVDQLKRVRALLDLARARGGSGESALRSSTELDHLRGWPSVSRLSCGLGRIAFILDAMGRIARCHEHPGPEHAISVLDRGVGAALRELPTRACFECWGPERNAMRSARKRGPVAVTKAHRSA